MLRAWIALAGTLLLAATASSAQVATDPSAAPGPASCRPASDADPSLPRLWTEARAALERATLGGEGGGVGAEGYTYHRVLDLGGLDVLQETTTPAEALEREAFVAAPPSELMTDGFILAAPGGRLVYRGLGAATLLSDEFADTYCLAVRRGGERIGLAFRPAMTREVVDVEGVLWLEGETLRLHSLEYRYTEHPVDYPIPDSRFGGVTRFRHLPDGAVAVEEAWVRMPALRTEAARGAVRRVSCESPGCDDEETLRKLAQAGLAVLDVGAATLRFRLADGSRLDVGRAAPGGAAIQRCDHGGRILYGTVRDGATGVPLSNATTRLLGGGGFLRSRRVLEERSTDGEGGYAFCDVPPSAETLVVEFLGQVEREVPLASTAAGPARLDVDLSVSGTAIVLGRVVRPDGGNGVPGIEVRFLETGQRAITDRSGRFVFDSVASGRLTLETHHLAYRTTTATVDVEGGERLQVELRVDDQVLAMEPLVVTARSRPLLMEERMGGFYRRQARGMGTFLDREDLAHRSTVKVTDVLREVHGLDVASTGSGTILKSTRNPKTFFEDCSPVVYVDRIKIPAPRLDPATNPLAELINRQNLEDVTRIIDSIRPDEIAGIEIYPGPSTVPGEFAGLDTDCGVIAIWTVTRDRSPQAHGR